MTEHFVSFIDDIWNKFPKFKEVKNTDLTNHNILWTLEEYRKINYVNFQTGKKELYRLSILIENYAVKHNTPLLATFETEARYKYVEERYREILDKISKAWIIVLAIKARLVLKYPKGGYQILFLLIYAFLTNHLSQNTPILFKKSTVVVSQLFIFFSESI